METRRNRVVGGVTATCCASNKKTACCEIFSAPAVPPLAAKHAEQVLNQTLAEAGVARSQITQWIWHAGGREVLLALQERLGLEAEDVRLSAAVLREFGNVSSPCVYFVLQAALADSAPGGFWWMSSFGAGFQLSWRALLEVG